MEFWNQIVNAALLGSAKKQVSLADLPADLAVASEPVVNSSIDQEEKFLQLAAIAFNYKQCGVQTSQKEKLHFSVSSPEEKKYATKQAIQSLTDVLHEGNNALLIKWLELCSAADTLVYPEFIPHLFSIAEKQKDIRTIVKNCSGKRGEWLSQFNPAWNFSSGDSVEEQWQTGTLEQRKLVLQAIRETEPEKALQWLQQCWGQEDANTKVELLKILAIRLSPEEESWLTTLLNEKSQKVKAEAWNLLKQLPGSFILKKYEELLRQSVIIKKEKALLGLINKNKIELKMPSSVDEIVFKSGIEKLSGSKEISDEAYLIYQLLHYLPPSVLEQLFEASPEGVINLLNKDNSGKQWLMAIASAIERFRNKAWARQFALLVDVPFREILSQLEEEELNDYLIKHFSNDPGNMVNYALAFPKEWSSKLALVIIQYAMENPYQFNKQFYNQNIQLIPVDIKDELFKIKADPLKINGDAMKEHILRLLALKEHVLQSFPKR